MTFGGAGPSHPVDPILDFTAQNSYTDGRHRDPEDHRLHERARVHVLEAPERRLRTRRPGDSPVRPARRAVVVPLQAAQSGTVQKTLGFATASRCRSATTTSATGATQTTGAAIGAGRYLSKRVYVEAKQTTTGQGQIQVDIELSKHLKLQTKLGNSTAITQGTTPENDPGSSVGLIYPDRY